MASSESILICIYTWNLHTEWNSQCRKEVARGWEVGEVGTAWKRVQTLRWVRSEDLKYSVMATVDNTRYYVVEIFWVELKYSGKNKITVRWWVCQLTWWKDSFHNTYKDQIIMMYTVQYFTILFFSYTSVIILTIILKILEFPTSRLEMSAVADIFDRDGDGYIDYYEFVAALHPNKDAYKPVTDADKIEDEVLHTPTPCNSSSGRCRDTMHRCRPPFYFHLELCSGVCWLCSVMLTLKWTFHHCFWQVTRQVAKCKCAKRFQVEQIGDNKYRVSFQKLTI